jgi:hypothetical protein
MYIINWGASNKMQGVEEPGGVHGTKGVVF